MNVLWGAMIIVSLIFGAVNGCISETVDAGINAAGGSVTVVLSFAGIMCLWSGIMRLCDKGGISAVIEKILSPVTRLLFPKLKNNEAKKAITMNMTANLLGMGNAATPLGIDAMHKLDLLNKNPQYATRDMCTFVVLNTASLQLIPTTIMSLRAAAGSQNAGEIIVPIWIASFVSLTVAVVFVKLLCRRRA
jgi:spore maturation protein A